MKFNFIGDIATPDASCTNDLIRSVSGFQQIFQDAVGIANLEGLIHSGSVDEHKPILYNDESVFSALKEMNIRGVSLANNHTLDLPHNYDKTYKLLGQNAISHSGAGLSWESAREPAVFECNGKKIVLISACWDVMLQHQKNPDHNLHVNRFNPDTLLDQVKQFRKEIPDAIIVLNLHWNLDLETIPFPMYRVLSKKLIDTGANVINGCHSHCIQGAERYKKGLIIYCPGNFFMPWYTFINGTLELPEFTKKEMIVSWDSDSGTSEVHFFDYIPGKDGHQISHICTEDFDGGSMINHYSPYRGLDNNFYVKWYKENRRKNKYIPVYKDPENRTINNLYDQYMKIRIRVLRFLAHKQIRSWNN